MRCSNVVYKVMVVLGLPWLGALVGCADMFRSTATGAGREWHVVPQNEVDACFVDGHRPVETALPTLFFQKKTGGRALLALSTTPGKDLAGAKALALRYSLHLSEGEPPRLAAVLFEKDGGVWFKISPKPLVAGWPELEASLPEDAPDEKREPTSAAAASREFRLPLSSLKQVAFSADDDGELQRENVTKVWLGLVMQGPALGAIELFEVAFTAEPFRATRPLRVPEKGAGTWTVGHDPAVHAKVTTPNEGPDGRACMKFEFSFPPHRHMYALPTLRLPEAEYEGYKALRFTYRAELPKGIGGLLVTLFEQDGSQYRAEPAPPPSKDWRTVTLPFEAFKLGEWSSDENGQLDLSQLGSVVIGLHGTAQGEKNDGVIRVTDVEFVP